MELLAEQQMVLQIQEQMLHKIKSNRLKVFRRNTGREKIWT